jgi:CDGSH-type Zn-finger protein
MNAEPIPAQRAPYPVEVKAGETYWWCACGRSARQPFCDGSHKDTGLAPVRHEAARDGTLWFCGCKATGRAPLCDGAHNRLPD